MRLLISRVFLLLIVAQLLVLSGLGQKSTSVSWEDKPVSEWNDGDVRKILYDSPWSQLVSGKVGVDPGRFGPIGYDSSILFTLRSALVVRFAMIRGEQLKAKYDSMDPKAKADLNKRLKPLLDCSLCERSYIIAVRGDSEFLQQASRVKNRSRKIYLTNEKGERRELSSYSPQTSPGTEALFFFDRFDASGKPLLTPDNVTLTFHFEPEPNLEDWVVRQLERVQINVSDIVRENQVIF